MKWGIAILVVINLYGCATGRCWDTPADDVHSRPLYHLSGLTLYIDGKDTDIRLVQDALMSAGYDELNLIRLENRRQNNRPVLKVLREPPKENIPTSISLMLSGLTFSLLPGYTYRSSRITFQLKLPDADGSMVSYNYIYKAKRHYVLWLPLGLGGNVTSTVQSHDEPVFTWHKKQKILVLHFFQDVQPVIAEYRQRLENRRNTRALDQIRHPR